MGLKPNRRHNETRRLVLLAVVLCTWLLCIQTVSADHKSTNQRSNFSSKEWKSSIVDNEYIVMFKEYSQPDDHSKTIESIVGSEGWKIRPRFNPSSEYDTDFVILQVNSKLESRAILKRLRASDEVKHVLAHRKFTNILSESFEPPQQEKQMTDLKMDRVKEGEMSNQVVGEEVEVKYRKQTTFEVEDEQEMNITTRVRRRLQADTTPSVPHLLNARYLWEEGFTGKGIKVAVFDTGLEADHPHFRHIVSRTDWTDEGTKDDVLGHGTFVSGVIASDDAECQGFAPDADIYSFRVFTANKVSYTAWFLDAFNFAIQKRINILNLSIGGPDFMDRPFVEKVWEMSANKIIVVSAIGNDGPVYGTLNNPADHLDVIGVGGIDFKDQVASFSSRGMTTWELPRGSGRVKPDIMAYGQAVLGSAMGGGCKTLSGTSVASPVIAGAVALLASTLPEATRWQILNPASMKQVLLSAARTLPQANIYEQGAGKLDLIESFAHLQSYTPQASFFPPSLDLTECPYLWPYCSQSLFHGAMPTIFNATILNGMGSSGVIVGEPKWIPSTHGDMLEVSFTHSEYLWPWSGWLGLHLRVAAKAAKWQGVAQGIVELVVQSPPVPPETSPRTQTIRLPVKANIIPTPPRAKRILWDQFHNIRYPSGYLPRDALWIKQEPFDWNGDHLYTNFRDLYNHLRAAGFYLDILGDPYTCFNASSYSTLLIVDPEEEFFAEEIAKLTDDVKNQGLSIAVFADWYSTDIMKKINFFDENTKRMWTPITGGSNIPALNELLKPWNIQFGDIVYDGEFVAQSQTAHFASGTSIAHFPKDGILIPASLKDQSAQITHQKNEVHPVPILGFYALPELDPANKKDGAAGRISVFGDSSCLDSASKSERRQCFWLAKDILMYTSQGILPTYATPHSPLTSDYISQRVGLPKRADGNQLFKFSKVLGHEPVCQNLDFKRFNLTTDNIVIDWPARRGPESTNQVLFREGQSKARNNSTGSGYGVVGPFLLGGATVLVIVIIFLRYTKSRRSVSYTPTSTMPAYL